MAAPQLHTPQNLAEVEALVVELYEPGNPARISQIQQSLHSIQRSPEGWQLANSLLQSTNDKVQFFGALTFTVKLNTDSASLSSEDAKEVLNQVLSWLVASIQRGSPALVIRKLCNTLVVYFLNFSSTWTLCVKHLLLCLYADQVVDTDLQQDAPSIAQLYEHLSPAKIAAALSFATALAEDVGKTDGNNIKHHKFHDMLRKNAQDVVDLIRPGIQPASPTLPTHLRQESMKCFQSWLLYSHRVLIDTRTPLEELKTLSQQAIACLVDDDLYEVTADLLTDTLVNYSGFFAEEDFDLLFSIFTSDWSMNRYGQLTQGDFGFDSLQYGQLLLAFGDARIAHLIKSKDDASRRFISALEGLLTADGAVFAEDSIFIPALEFWSTFVEYMTDSLYSDDETASLPDVLAGEEVQQNQSVVGSEWFIAARDAVLRVIEHCWRKIQFPPEDEWRSWESTDRTGFKDARMEVIDLLQASFTLTGIPLFSMFADMTLRSLGNRMWDELEASLFCLSGLVDFVPDDDSADAVLRNVISSNLFAVLSDPSSGATARARQAALSLIGKYDEFFKKHSEYLPQALTFLFQAVTTPQLAASASKSIYSLCFSCRQALVGEIAIFTQQYHELAKIENGDSIVNERLAGAIAAIIQAIPQEDLKQPPLMSLLQSVGIEFQRCMKLLSEGNMSDAEARAIEVLRCVQGIAKGLQVPADVPVEISDNDVEQSDQYWLTGAGRNVQEQVQTLVQTCIASFPQSSELVDTACGVYRAGFIERVPGPFVFSPDTVVDFVTSFSPQNGRIVAVINTACCFVSAQGSKKDAATIAALSRLCAWLLSVIQTMQEPSADPDTAQTAIDFLHRLLSRNAGLVFGQSANIVEHILMFVLSAFRGRDPLPKASAGDFLSTLLSLSDLDPEVQATADAAVQHIGQFIADAIIFNISGNAARSEVDKVCDPLKKLVIRHPGAKVWLQKAMFSGNFGSDRIKDADKTMFLQKILNLRGGRETNRVAKNFWLDCRGSNFAYTS